MSWMGRLLQRLFPPTSKWKPVAKGPVTIKSMQYKMEPVEIKGTYVKERNQFDEERYWITEPDGTCYVKAAEFVRPDVPTEAPHD